MARVAINGLGRIGRAALKILMDTPELELVAANDLASADNLVYLLRYDTVYGRYNRPVAVDGNHLVVGEQRIRLVEQKDPAQCPWGELGVQIVFECTGVFTREEDLKKHIQAGARNVILSAPSKTETVSTVVHGANRLEGELPQVVSCASCTTNCVTPVVEVLDRRIGIVKALMTTVHAYTSSQSIVDGPGGKDFRRGRAAAANFVPASTGAAVATARALPQLKGKFDGVSIRGPVPAGSIADIVCLVRRPTSVDEVNHVLSEEAATDRYRGVLRVSEDPLVSADILGDTHASIVDAALTQVVDGDLVKVMSWYDNEWGYASQMIRHAVSVARQLK